MRLAALVGAALALLPAASADAQARSCAGVAFPEAVVVAGQRLALNGLGLREMTLLDVDVFVAALYVARTTNDAEALLRSDAPARVVLRFVRDATAGKIVEEFERGFRANAPHASAAKKQRLYAWLTDIKAGQSLEYTYEPGKGLEVRVAGRVRGTIPGPEFASATLAVLIGPHAADADLRAGLLGGACE